MMRAELTQSLSSSQAEQLARSCAAYRTYAWQRLPPSAERNQLLKVAQAVQGRLSEARAVSAETVWLAVSEEEKLALRQMASTLMQVYGTEAPSVARNRALGELAGVRLLIERIGRPTQVF